MEALAFLLAWMLREAWDEKRYEYRTGRDANREKAIHRNGGARPSAGARTRADSGYAVGFSLYQLRHGWPSLRRNIKAGYRAAKEGHKEWVEETNRASGKTKTKKPSIISAAKAAWRRAKAAYKAREEADDKKTIKPTGADQPKSPNGQPDQTADSTPAATGTKPPELTAPDLKVGIPLTNGYAGNPHSGAATAGEAGNIGLYRNHLQATITDANARITAAEADVAAAEKAEKSAREQMSAHDNANGGLLAAGLGPQTAGGMSSLMEQAQAELASATAAKTAAQGRVDSAQQSKAVAEQALKDLGAQGHEGIEEAVNGATAPVAKNTNWYGGS